MKLKIDVRIPIAPVPSFLNRVRLIQAAFQQWGEPWASAVLNVACNAPAEGETYVDPNIAGVTFRITPREETALWKRSNSPNAANIISTRFDGETSANLVLMLDGDILPITPPDMGKVGAILSQKAVAGFPAHVSPFIGANFATWDSLLTAQRIHISRMSTQYSGWNIMTNDQRDRFGPRGYYNTGVLFIAGQVFPALCESMKRMTAFVRARMDSYFIDQIALALALEDQNIPALTTDASWNFPNQPEFDAAFPYALQNVHFLHFLRTDRISRDRDFTSLAAMTALSLRTDLSGSNDVLRKRVAELLPLLGG
jgi:hypothetical protein